VFPRGNLHTLDYAVQYLWLHAKAVIDMHSFCIYPWRPDQVTIASHYDRCYNDIWTRYWKR